MLIDVPSPYMFYRLYTHTHNINCCLEYIVKFVGSELLLIVVEKPDIIMHVMAKKGSRIEMVCHN